MLEHRAFDELGPLVAESCTPAGELYARLRRRGYQDTAVAQLLMVTLSKGHATSRCPECRGTVAWSKEAGPAGRYGVCVTCRKEYGRLLGQGPVVSRCPSCTRPVAIGSRVICLVCGFDNTRELDSSAAVVVPHGLTRQLRDRTCRAPRCGRRFVPRHGKARYCSTNCRVRNHRATRRYDSQGRGAGGGV